MLALNPKGPKTRLRYKWLRPFKVLTMMTTKTFVKVEISEISGGSVAPIEGWLLEGVGWLDLERAYKVYAEREEKPPTPREVYLEVYGVWAFCYGSFTYWNSDHSRRLFYPSRPIHLKELGVQLLP